ncbi:MAG: fibronectin type III domain-containing protein [Bacteroidota bacterium]|nr:fibronectin type III domain-containing protein [Bacteroidota bacterium]
MALLNKFRNFFLILIFFSFVHKANAQAITAPENLTAESTSQTEIVLAWDDNNKNKTYYEVERSIGNENNFEVIALLSTKASTYTDKNLTANTTYYYRIHAVIKRIFGQSAAYSNIANATTLPNPPAAPTDLKVATSWQTEINISWKDNADNEEGFKLERSEKNNSNFVEIATFQPNTVSYNDKNLKSNTTYFYRIRSFNAGGNSNFSEQGSATTYQYQPTITPIPDPPAIYENSDTQKITLTGISDGGDGGQLITITATSSNLELMPNPQIVYSSPANTAKLRYRTNRNKFGTSTITVTVTDNGPSDGPVKNSVSQSFKITVLELNDPPTLNAISNPTPIFENSETQTIPLSGITAGPEEDQTITITATSSNPDLIPNPVISYTSPQGTGTLSYKPVANKTGKATIIVTLKDNGPSTDPHQNTLKRKFDVTVLWVNKAPTLDAIADPAPVQHTSGQQTVSLTGISAGPNDDQKLTVTAKADKPELLKDLSVEYTSPQSTAIVKYIPIPDKLGTAIITVTVKDDGPGTSPHVNTISRSFNVRITDIPLVAETSFPEYYTSSSTETIGITVHDNITVDKVELHYRHLNENDWKIENLSGNGRNYNIPTPADAFLGPVGIEYFFVVSANGTLQEESNKGKTYIKYIGDGLPVPDLIFGDTEAHYQIVSIPLNLAKKDVPSVFEDDLGTYDPTQWRLFHYVDSAVEYPGKFSTIEAGKGYWLIIRRGKNVDTGEGTTFKVDRSTPFEINLKKGWNQIGNPYNFDLKWDDVLQVNTGVSGLGKLNVFEDGTLKESNTLKKFRGGFVFTENDVKISIPVVLPVNGSNGRTGEQTARSLGADGWEVQLNVKSSGNIQSIGGIGMKTDALPGKDTYDEVALPNFGFIQQVNFNFEHPEYFYPHFSKDIVPVSENHIWEFVLQSNTKGDLLELTWSSLELDEDYNISLLDISDNKVINMKEQNSYSIPGGKDRKFKVIYGNKNFLAENVKPEFVSFEKPYPNPFKDYISFPFAVSKSDKEILIQLNIYDVTGKVVATPVNKHFSPGFYEEKWDGNSFNGVKLKPGVYIYKMTISKDNDINEHKGRLILEYQ